jgi:hypothetical protein
MNIIHGRHYLKLFLKKKILKNFAFLCQFKTRDTALSVSEQLSSKKRKTTKCCKAEGA